MAGKAQPNMHSVKHSGQERGARADSQLNNTVAAQKCTRETQCSWCERDSVFLRSKQRPALDSQAKVIAIADLFAGCGGMTVGLAEAALRAGCRASVSLAVDSDAEATAIYKSNFPTANIKTGYVESTFDGRVGEQPTPTEKGIAQEAGPVDLLLGGPPCQGHSDLNNHTRRADPKNALFLCMARATEVLRPSVVIVENVPTVQHDRGDIVAITSAALRASGYDVSGRVVDLSKVGVPQRRKRYLLIASQLPELKPSHILDLLEETLPPNHRDRTVRWAIGDISRSMPATIFDTASRVSDDNQARIGKLFEKGIFDLPNRHRPECHSEKDHSYKSMYGRLRWSLPAQTVTTGFGSMGQGRYVHPERPRTLTPHEAARLQTFPDWFEFGHKTRRGALAKVIANAVPPLMMVELGGILLPAILRAKATFVPQERKRA